MPHAGVAAMAATGALPSNFAAWPAARPSYSSPESTTTPRKGDQAPALAPTLISQHRSWLPAIPSLFTKTADDHIP